MKIYLDMDGVIANFSKRYEELFGALPAGERRGQAHFDKNWDDFVLGNNFTLLEQMPDAQELIEFVFSLGVPVEILSSSGGTKYHDAVRAQKIEWLSKHNLFVPKNIVPGGHLKGRYSYGNPWNILIDDTPRVIENYRKSGGTGILHTSAKDTIEQLKKLHYEWSHPEDSII
jgi:hypothetical protein